MAVQLDIIPETGSTNADLLARIAGGEVLVEGYWLIADRQSGGRGRQGRQWIDAPGNFMGSTVVRLSAHDPAPASLSFLAAIAVYEAVVGKLGNPDRLQIKWPNDLLLGAEKFCGILLERTGNTAIVGIGVNLAAAPALDNRTAASIAGAGCHIDRDLFARDLANSFERELHRWREFGTGPLFNRWQAVAHRPGTPLSVHDDRGGRVTGTFEGLETDGALRLKLPDGSTRVIHAGEVNLEA